MWESEGAPLAPVRPRGGSPGAPERHWQRLLSHRTSLARREEEGWESGGLYPATPVLPALSASVQGIPGGGTQLSHGCCTAWSQAWSTMLHSLSWASCLEIPPAGAGQTAGSE